MGLDQFAYTVDKSGEKKDIAYWRKHPNLQGWMAQLWESKGCPNKHKDFDDFNTVPLELTANDLDSLEHDITNSHLPDTVGFFFGKSSDDHYKEQDLEFIRQARQALDNGQTVVYDSWW
jgi:hypothetical protein